MEHYVYLISIVYFCVSFYVNVNDLNHTKFNTRKVDKQKKTAGRDIKDKIKIHFKKVSIHSKFLEK